MDRQSQIAFSAETETLRRPKIFHAAHDRAGRRLFLRRSHPGQDFHVRDRQLYRKREKNSRSRAEPIAEKIRLTARREASRQNPSRFRREAVKCAAVGLL